VTRVVVVGAGLSGLAAAGVLAERAETVVVDRLPAIGGMAGWEDPIARRLDEAGRAAGMRRLLGTTALRWEPGRLLVAAPGDIRWIDADHLVFAGGTRPATPADLRLVGDRPAGVIAATVAEHLLAARVTLGRRVIVLGVSHWAALVAHRMHLRGAPARLLGLPGDLPPAWADEWLGTATPRAVHGSRRIEELEVEREPGGDRERIPCDALVIAAPARPIRNVEGAVFDGERVTFMFETDLAASAADIVDRAQAAARGITLEPGRVVA
jgi:NADPH-dependent 2,4-dienoyl-CoA reductase/sulfur reductase-like enzyme